MKTKLTLALLVMMSFSMVGQRINKEKLIEVENYNSKKDSLNKLVKECIYRDSIFKMKILNINDKISNIKEKISYLKTRRKEGTEPKKDLTTTNVDLIATNLDSIVILKDSLFKIKIRKLSLNYEIENLKYPVVNSSRDTLNRVKTTVFNLNLSKPTERSLLTTDRHSARLRLKSKSPLQFKLTGGNPFRYKYVINNKFINYFPNTSDDPLNLEKVKNDTKIKVPDSQTQETKNENQKKDSITTSIAIKDINKNIKKDLTEIDKQNKRYDELSNKKKLSKKEVVEKARIEKTKSTIAERIKNDSLKLATLSNKNETYEYKPIAKKVREINKHYKNLYIDSATNIDEDKINMINAVGILNDESNILLDEIIKYETKIYACEELPTDIQFKAADFKKQASTIIEFYYDLRRESIQFKASTLGDNYNTPENTLKQNLIAIGDHLSKFLGLALDNYTLPIDINGKNIDAVGITVERFDNKRNDPRPLDSFEYTVWIRGGLKIDVSGGIYVTTLVNHEYYIENAPGATDTNSKIIKERQKGNLDFGFGSSINISRRSAGWANPTLNVGAIFTNNQQFQLLGGVGLILGKQERVIFSSGVSMGRVTKLADNFEAGGSTPYNLGNGAVPTSNVFAFGYYFGVTYNLSKTKKNGEKTKESY